MTESLLKTYSLGYCTRDIKEDSQYCDFFPVERMPGFTGVIDESTPEIATTTDIDGKISVIKIDKSVKIMAKWFNNGDSNRLTPPNICKGETIMLYRYSNTDKYYWSTIFNELDLRKLEKATYVFSNKRSIVDKSKIDKVYYFTVDTINKFIKLFTDDSDGELTTYDLEINTKDGIMTMIDGFGNMIQMDSSEDTYNIHFNKDHNLIIDETVNETIGKDRNTTIGGNSDINTTGSVTETIGEKKVIITPKISISNDTAEIIATLSDLVQANIDHIGVGNLNADVPCNPATVSAYKAIKEKIDSFKL